MEGVEGGKERKEKARQGNERKGKEREGKGSRNLIEAL